MQTKRSPLGKLLGSCDPQGSYETGLQGLWSRVSLDCELRLSDGGSLKVLSRGTWNVEAGPDFLNAKLLIDGKLSRGDVEVHRKASDWSKHGHQKDPAYSRVVLHVVESDDRAALPGAPALPTFVIGAPAAAEAAPRTAKGRCAGRLSALPAASLRAAFCAAGMERLGAKADDALSLAIANGEDFAYLSKLFDAAGCKANREGFAETLKRYLSHPLRERALFREALLWGESGLLPDPSAEPLDSASKEKAKALWSLWWPLRGSFSAPVAWKRSGCRPLNSPERRLAALAALLSRSGEGALKGFYKSLRSSSPDDFNKQALTALSASDPFWDRRTGFRKAPLRRAAAVSGPSLALELAVNALYPCLLAMARLGKDPKAESALRAAYLALQPRESNRTLKNALERWFLEPKKAERALSCAAARQGALQLYANYCEKAAADCESCLLFNSIRCD